MAYLVTGGHGFLGRRVTGCLRAAGRRVIALDTTARSVPGVESVTADVRNVDALCDVIVQHRVQAIVHLAYLLSADAEENPLRAVDVNVAGTNAVLEAARRTGVARVVYSSSIAVCGAQAYFGPRRVGEDDGLAPVILVYGATKLLNEVMAAKFDSPTLACVGVRLSYVFGHGRVTGASTWASDFASRPAAGEDVELPFPARAKFSLIHVDDAAALVALLATAPALRHRLYFSGGDVVAGTDLVRAVRCWLPEARFTFAEDRPAPGLVWLIDDRRVRDELRFRRAPFPRRVRDHIAETRAALGLPPLRDPTANPAERWHAGAP